MLNGTSLEKNEKLPATAAKKSNLLEEIFKIDLYVEASNTFRQMHFSAKIAICTAFCGFERTHTKTLLGLNLALKTALISR